MERVKWKFTYEASKLHDAAKAKLESHTKRLEWWTDKQNEIKEKIKEEGIQIDESVATNTPKFSNAYRTPSASIRNDLLEDLSETIAKVQEHKQKVKEYDAWTQVMAAHSNSVPSNVYELTQDDWMFFFGK